MRWLLLALISGLVFIYGLYVDSTELRLITKGLPVIALIFWLGAAPAGTYRRWISLGLLFGLGGDILLDIPEEHLANQFVFGLGSFLIGHLAYIRAYTSDSRRLAPVGLLFALACGGSMLSMLNSSPDGLGAFFLPVAVYALVISCMLWRAIARLGVDGIPRDAAWLAAGGALLFVISDAMIGINRFVQPFEEAKYAIIITYWLGQFGIAASAMRRNA
ncbi:lysoplasmalogenase [Pseudomonas sp. N040]|uniref:lysoplasmalogenase n=1 Tax=Pseudomonas sp. N040 TaxID=2785325 RepID=UPI0018A25742|nr:lysoplasmalogenase [Pseudomonas sp. N040]MBF7731623.1 lysoplasmalogenase [Pseudomonas sp. N040]MBW7015267.1 lysoplasmalogenase [Pseudomonas sp. N040]